MLDELVLFGGESTDKREWYSAIQEALQAPILRLVGLEVNLPGMDMASLESRHCAQLRHLALRGGHVLPDPILSVVVF